MTKHSGAWDGLKWEVQTICAWKQKTQKRCSQKSSACWPQLSAPWRTKLIWMGETEGQGTAGGGCRVSGGPCWERLACGNRSGGPTWWEGLVGTQWKKSHAICCINTSRVICCDETSIILEVIMPQLGFPGGSDGSVCLQCGRPGFDHWVRKNPWRRKWQPTPVLLPGKSYGQRSLVGYGPWGSQRVGHDWETPLSLRSECVDS